MTLRYIKQLCASKGKIELKYYIYLFFISMIMIIIFYFRILLPLVALYQFIDSYIFIFIA
jgi:hypothetical protein